MTQQQIQSKLKDILIRGQDIDCPVENISQESSLIDLGINSVTFIKFIIMVEDEFGIRFSDQELNPADYATLQELGECIAKKTSSKGG